MKVMAIDPGGTTGVAVMEMEKMTILRKGIEERHWLIEDESLVVAQYGTPQEDLAALRIFERIVEERPHVVVIEDFRLFPNMRHSPDPVGTLPDRLIARLDLLLYLWEECGWVVVDGMPKMMPAAVVAFGRPFGSPLVRKQMPGERVTVSDASIKKLGWWRTEKKDGGGPHAMDALRHLIVYYGKIRNGGEL